MYQWESPYVGKYHATINGKRLEIERERGSGIPRYKMYADKKFIGDYGQLNGAKTKLIKLATGQPTMYTKNTLPSEMPSRDDIKAGLEAAGYKVTDTNLDKASSAKMAVIERPSGLTVKMTPAEVLRICAKHSKTGQELLEETERTGELPPVAVEEDYIDDFGLDAQPHYHYPADQPYVKPEQPWAEPQPVQARQQDPQPAPQPAVQSIAPKIATPDCPPGMAYVTITGFVPVEALKDVKDTVELLRAAGTFTAHVKMPTDLDF
jgi:hypothetical protein